MKNRKYAEKFLFKSQQDLLVLKKIYPDLEIVDEIKGFHAQQAAEKMLKAILTYEGIEFPFTHRLSDLLDLLKDNQINVPDTFEELRFLTPFAVDFRYDYFEDAECVKHIWTLFEFIFNILFFLNFRHYLVY